VKNKKFIELIPIGNSSFTIGYKDIGSRLPIIQGTSFAFIPIMLPFKAAGLGAVFTAAFIGKQLEFGKKNEEALIAKVKDGPELDIDWEDLNEKHVALTHGD